MIAELAGAHAYVTFSLRDPCPNSVIEAMSCGTPVLGIKSGGIPDIVGDAGILLDWDDFADGYFVPYRFEEAFPPIDFRAMTEALVRIVENNAHYRQAVRRRFETDLGIDVVAGRYMAVVQDPARPAQ